MKIHLDTDLGGDPDDACALALLLRSPDVEVTGITTVLDGDGQRAAYTEHVLRLAGRSGIPVIAGAGATLTGNQARPDGLWPELPPRPAAPGAALDLLAASVATGSTIVAIGPLTNLGLLETVRPGTLAGADVVAMGGYLDPPADGLPQWGPEMDWNIQFDTRAARIVTSAAGRRAPHAGHAAGDDGRLAAGR
jgi:purine nucleosidase